MTGLLEAIATREGLRAALRGHILEPWQQDGRYTAVTWCSDCSLALTIDSHPQADDLPVDGSVAHMACSRKRDTPPIWAPQIPKLMRAIA